MTAEHGVMAEIALYYPYVHPRDESWVKQALLLAEDPADRPGANPTTDSPLPERLVKEKMLVERRPGPAALEVSGSPVEYIARHETSLRAGYRAEKALALPPSEPVAVPGRAGAVELHLYEFVPMLQLVALELGTPVRVPIAHPPAIDDTCGCPRAR